MGGIQIKSTQEHHYLLSKTANSLENILQLSIFQIVYYLFKNMRFKVGQYCLKPLWLTSYEIDRNDTHFFKILGTMP